MNRRKLLSLLGASPALLAGSVAHAERPKEAAGAAAAGGEAKVTAITPKGTPPPVMRYGMAERTATSVDGKTIYLVDTGFFGGDMLIAQFAAWFQRNMPTVKVVSRKKKGTYPTEDPELWKEIKTNAYATIMAIGH